MNEDINRIKVVLVEKKRTGKWLAEELAERETNAKEMHKFSTPWNCFVLTLPKFNVDGVEGVYVIPDNVTEHGGQTSGQTDIDATIAEVLRLIKENPKITRKMLSNSIGFVYHDHLYYRYPYTRLQLNGVSVSIDSEVWI